jgi:hypothetical protein
VRAIAATAIGRIRGAGGAEPRAKAALTRRIGGRAAAQTRSGRETHLGEPPEVEVAEEQVPLRVRGARSELGRVVHDVADRDGQVEPRIVVGIEKTTPNPTKGSVAKPMALSYVV